MKIQKIGLTIIGVLCAVMLMYAGVCVCVMVVVVCGCDMLLKFQ